MIRKIKQAVKPPYAFADIPYLIPVFILLIIIPITVVLLTIRTFISAQAQSTSILTATSGVMSGNIIVGTDPSASGGKYIQFGSTTLPTSGILATVVPLVTNTPVPPSPTSPPPTLPATPTPAVVGTNGDPVILAAGDIACGTGQIGSPQNPQSSNACWQYNTAALVKSLLTTVPNVQGILELGDIQYPGTYYGDFAQYFGNTTQGWGDPQILNLSDPVPGNHDYTAYSSSNPLNVQPPAAYKNFFGNRAVRNSKTYYSYNLGAWHIVALDSNCTDMAGNEFPSGFANLVNCDKTPGADENSWLQTDLSQYGKTGTIQPHACILQYFHHPMFTSWFDLTNFNDKWMMWAWQDLYNAHGDIILNGHAHMYERFLPQQPNGTSNNPPVDTVNGITEIIAGTAGRNLDPKHSNASNEVAFNNNTMGVLQLTLHAKSADFKFIPDPQAGNGTFTDAGTIACH